MAHGDYTGTQKARLATQFAEQQAFAAQNMTTVSEITRAASKETIDLWNDRDEENLRTKTVVGDNDEAQVVEVDVEDPQFRPVKFMASETVDQVTVGQGRDFSLEAGRTYTAPRWVAQHLDEQGLVYH